MTITVKFTDGSTNILQNADIKKDNSKMLYIWYTDENGMDTSVVYDPEKVEKVLFN
jgi:hypothetical protein